jgi:DNA-binding response OmpR family regulator
MGIGRPNGASPSQVHGRVLVVDDDRAVLSMIERVLQLEGFDVETAATAPEARQAVVQVNPDVILLDVMLAGDDGFDVLTELRRTNDVPVILVTGRAEEPDRVLGLRMGADDYITKPFSYPELVARIQAVLRRSRPKTDPTRRSFGRLELDLRAREVWLDGQLIDTTAKEFDLLAFLSESPRQVFSRGQLLEHVWGSSAEWQDPATVTEHVRRLRVKLNEDPDQPGWIATVRGVGYRFEAEPARDRPGGRS